MEENTTVGAETRQEVKQAAALRPAQGAVQGDTPTVVQTLFSSGNMEPERHEVLLQRV